MTFATANVVIIGTRVIFLAEQKSVNVQLQNSSSDPALVQSWLDRGDINSRPNSIQVPFLVTPPVVRIEPNAGQTLRVVFIGKENLPQDRETLFYLNVLDVPPKPKAEDLGTNYLQFAIRSRIKFFYRPALS